VSAVDFKILKLLGTGAFGRVYLVKKLKGADEGKVYAMKVLEKVLQLNNKKKIECTRSERQVLEKIIDCPFLAKMYYAFQTPEKLYLVLGFEQGGELFTHRTQPLHFTESQVRFYIAEIIIALEQLHKVNLKDTNVSFSNFESSSSFESSTETLNSKIFC
jgi:ribosomal protein S6 kinase alpha-5